MAGFRKKQPQQAALKYGIYGPSGSGKTFTSLMMAEGLAKLDHKRVAFVDTEYGSDFYAQSVKQRRIHPEAFDFDALDTRSLSETLSEVKRLSPEKYAVVVIDSITHLWEAARNAYEGRMTKTGSIPFHAWGKIKKPYKELIAFLLSSPMHVIICGRQGNEFAEDEETEEIKVVGVKMKAEGETPYEPHILLRMEPQKDKIGNATYRVFAEKDRTGVLAGRIISNPGFESLCLPLLPLLGRTQAALPTEDETAAQDAIALADAEAAKSKASAEKREEFEARFKLAKNKNDLEAVSKELTAAIKKTMTTQDVTALRDAYRTREQQLSGEFRLEAVE